MQENIDQKFINELCNTLRLAGFDSNYLSIVASYGYTMDKQQCLDLLKQLNKDFSKVTALYIARRLTHMYEN